MTARHLCFLIHRYTGLGIVIFLLITSLTGMMLAFTDELDDWFNRDMVYVEVTNQPIDIAKLHDSVIGLYPRASFSSLPTEIEVGHAIKFSIDRNRDKKVKAAYQFNYVYINPYTAEITGTRNINNWSWRNTMNKVFQLHRNLLLDDIGKTVLGITALIWTLNCFIGFYLTLPRPSKKKTNNQLSKMSVRKSTKRTKKKRKPWLKRWLPAWIIRTRTNTFKLNYDLHQALSLWLWIMLFAIAWSSVSFNLKEVYNPVMKVLVGYESPNSQSVNHSMSVKKIDKTVVYQQQDSSLQASVTQLASHKRTSTDKKDNSKEQNNNLKQPINLVVNKYNSIDILKREAAKVAMKKGVKVKEYMDVKWNVKDKQWKIRFVTNKDVGRTSGASSLTLDALTGKVINTKFGHDSTVGQKAHNWITSLHMGHIGHGLFSLAYRIFLALVALIVMILSITGTYLWLKSRKRQKKKFQ